MPISPLEYLKQEEKGQKENMNVLQKNLERAVQDTEFWAEVNRIQASGGWRAEEERLSRGEGTLTLEQQAQLDSEARELIKARRELLKKKKEEEGQRKQDEARVRELLKNEPALSWKMCVSSDGGVRRVPHSYGVSEFYGWDPTTGYSTKEMLEAYDEIQVFRGQAQEIVKDAIQKAMDDLWSDSTDERIFQREEIQNSGGCGWTYPHQSLEYHMGTLHKNDTNAQDYWKTHILREIGQPLFHEEYQKWYFYCHKFLERSKGKPKMLELLNRIQELEKQNEALQKKNSLLEEKYNSIRMLLNSN
jgi:hypothetical protein